jgi:hypothetical protein
MYTLRIKEKTRKDIDDEFDEVYENFNLGDSYSVLIKDKTNEFYNVITAEYPDTKTDNMLGLICGENRKEFFIEEYTPLKQFEYFIMSDNGQTFERL